MEDRGKYRIKERFLGGKEEYCDNITSERKKTQKTKKQKEKKYIIGKDGVQV